MRDDSPAVGEDGPLIEPDFQGPALSVWPAEPPVWDFVASTLGPAQIRVGRVLEFRNRPVTKGNLFPTSTALSPIRSIARAASNIVIAHSRRSGSSPIFDRRGEAVAVQPVDQVVPPDQVPGGRLVAIGEACLA